MKNDLADLTETNIDGWYILYSIGDPWAMATKLALSLPVHRRPHMAMCMMMGWTSREFHC